MLKKKKIKALLLAAGYGTRLKPITLTTPKCLVKINGQPLLINWLDKLESIGCEEVLINTHYLSKEVEKTLSNWNNEKIKIKTVFEEKLLGTGGTLQNNIDFFDDCIGLIIHADNFTTLDLEKLLNSHFQRDPISILTMLTFKTDRPKDCGVVITNKNGLLLDYFEKVNNPPSNIANGAVFVFEKSFLKFLENLEINYKDFCKDLIPKLKGKIQTYFTNSIFIDIGTPQSLEKANTIVQKRT